MFIYNLKFRSLFSNFVSNFSKIPETVTKSRRSLVEEGTLFREAALSETIGDKACYEPPHWVGKYSSKPYPSRVNR